MKSAIRKQNVLPAGMGATKLQGSDAVDAWMNQRKTQFISPAGKWNVGNTSLHSMWGGNKASDNMPVQPLVGAQSQQRKDSLLPQPNNGLPVGYGQSAVVPSTSWEQKRDNALPTWNSFTPETQGWVKDQITRGLGAQGLKATNQNMMEYAYDQWGRLSKKQQGSWMDKLSGGMFGSKYNQPYTTGTDMWGMGKL